MRYGTLLILLAAAIAGPRGAMAAGPTVQIWVDDGEKYVNQFPHAFGNAIMDVVITVNTDGADLSGVEFDFEGVPFWAATHIETAYPIPGTTNFGDAGNGQYRLTFQECVRPCERLEVLRIRYLFTNGGSGLDDMILSISGPGSSSEDPSITSCEDSVVPAPMGGAGGGYTCASWVWVPEGAVILYPQNAPCPLIEFDSYIDQADYVACELPVPVGTTTPGRLKMRYVK